MPSILIQNTNRYLVRFCAIIVLTLVLSSCKKLVEVKAPATSINSGNVYANDATAIAAVTQIYVSISQSSLPGGGVASLSLFPGLSSDEIALYPGTTNNASNYYYQNALSAINLNNPDFWTALYKIIYVTNAALEGLSASTSLTPAVKQQLLGEVKFMRAFCYFYLVNLYGDVPLVLTSDYKENSSVKRTAAADVYMQILADLHDAENRLSPAYLDATLLNTTTEKVRPTKWVAAALLARVDLYLANYSDAITESSAVIASGLYSLPPLSDVFKMNSAEAIWQIQPVNGGWNTEDAKAFLLPSNGPDQTSHPYYLSQQLLSSFESADQRKNVWIQSVTVGSTTYSYPAKYKVATYGSAVSEYEMVFRLAEQYLIRAEAEAQQNLLNEAKNDVNAVRQRAGLGNTLANDKTSLLTAILHERQDELFTEWGQRWFDLKRTKTVDAVMSTVTPQKGGRWSTDWQWYPISRSELLLNPALTQNQGY